MPHADLMHLRFARGWLELGCPAEARKELAGLAPRHAECLDALEIHFQLLIREQRFAEALPLAQRQQALFPLDLRGLMNTGNALFWLGRAQEAVDLVLPAVHRHPDETILPYNLACYLVRLDALDDARKWLRHAMKLGDPAKVVRHALLDADLEPLWPWLRPLAKAKT